MAKGIQDLPNELLFSVFDNLDDQSLSSLSLVSRAFHRPALETVIIRLGGNSNMEEEALFPDSPFALLRAVRSAIFIRYLKSVSVTILATGNIVFLAELAQLFNRMTHIGYVHIRISKSTGPVEDDVMLEMAHRIFASLAGKKCTTLVLDGWDLPDSKSESILPEGGNLCNSISARTSQPDNVFPLINTLTKLDLKHCRIFAKPIVRWIIDSSNQSPITQLSILHTSASYDECTSSSALSLLALPHLTSFSVFSHEIDVGTLLAFFCRHPTLKDILLLADRATGLDHSLPPPTFLNLENLAITSHLLPLILPLAALPQILKSVSLWSNRSSGGDIERSWIQSIEDAFTCLAERKGVERLAFSFPSEGIAKAWLTPERRNVERLMTFVKTVSIGTRLFHTFGTDMEAIFAKWLSLFPSVEHVEVDDYMFATGWNGSAFASRLAKECPRVRTVKFGFSQLYNLFDLKDGSDPKPEASVFVKLLQLSPELVA